MGARASQASGVVASTQSTSRGAHDREAHQGEWLLVSPEAQGGELHIPKPRLSPGRPVGAQWCIMVKKHTNRHQRRNRRFTVTLDEEDYQSLVEIGERSRPRLSLRYMVEFAVRCLLENADSSLADGIGKPHGGKKSQR